MPAGHNPHYQNKTSPPHFCLQCSAMFRKYCSLDVYYMIAVFWPTICAPLCRCSIECSRRRWCGAGGRAVKLDRLQYVAVPNYTTAWWREAALWPEVQELQWRGLDEAAGIVAAGNPASRAQPAIATPPSPHSTPVFIGPNALYFFR